MCQELSRGAVETGADSFCGMRRETVWKAACYKAAMSLCKIDPVDRSKLFEGSVEISKLPTGVIEEKPLPCLLTSRRVSKLIPWFLDTLLEALDSPSDSTSLVYLTTDTAKLPHHGMCDVAVVLRCDLHALTKPILNILPRKCKHAFPGCRGSICYDPLFAERSERMGRRQTNPNQLRSQ